MAIFKKTARKDKNGEPVNGAVINGDVPLYRKNQVYILVVTFIVIWLLSLPGLYLKINIPEIGEVVTEDIKAPFDFQVIDSVQTDLEKRKVAESVYPHFEYDPSIAENAIAVVRETFEKARSIQKIVTKDFEEKIDELQNTLGLSLTREQVRILLTNCNYNLLEDHIIKTQLERNLIEPIISTENLEFYDSDRRGDVKITLHTEDGIEVLETKDFMTPYQTENTIKSRAFLDWPKVPDDEKPRDLELALTIQMIRPNVFYNEDLTAAAILEAEREVKSVRVPYKKGEIIIRGGSPVTPYVNDIVEQFNHNYNRTSASDLLGRAVLLTILFALFIMHMNKYKKDIISDVKSLLIFAILAVLLLLAANILNKAQINLYLLPMAGVTMLCSLLIEPRLTLLYTFILSLALGIFSNNGFVAVVCFVGGSAAVYQLRIVSQRTDMIKSGIFTGVVLTLTLIGIRLIHGVDLQASMFLDDVLYGMVNGILSAMVAMILLPIFESSFGLVTDIKLLELASLNQPLLKKLRTETPGTYQHSMNMAILCESAAEAINANALLLRVGAYYHDIGKTKNPDYFTENQQNPDDKKRHQKLSANMSTLIIKNHIKSGIEMAREAGLPEAIVDFVPQHHGTSSIKYFAQQVYDQLEAEGKLDEYNEDEFRYSGPKPQTAEAAIMMIADSLEATARSIDNPTENDLEIVVRKTINDKFMDGQLDESNLSLRDLHILSKSFTETLTNLYHKRIAYPAPKE